MGENGHRMVPGGSVCIVRPPIVSIFEGARLESEDRNQTAPATSPSETLISVEQKISHLHKMKVSEVAACTVHMHRRRGTM